MPNENKTIEKQTAKDAIFKNCLSFLDKYLNEQLKGPDSQEMRDFFRQYDYTLERYVSELKEAASYRLLKALFWAEQKTDLNVPRNRKLEKQWTEICIFMMKGAMSRLRFKWFSVEHEPQGSIELSLTKNHLPHDFFNNLSLRAFELYRNARKTPFTNHIRGVLPILFFGGLNDYLYSDLRILTLGKAPSQNEYKEGVERFHESEVDFSTMFLPVPRPWEINQYLNVCSKYFDRAPNREYFKRFNPVLQKLNASYTCEDLRNATSKNIIRHRQPKDRKTQRNIAVHFNYYSPLMLDTTWDALSSKKRKVFSMEDIFPDILKALSPDIILCDFDIKGTCLAKGAKKTTIPSDWKLPKRYHEMPAYLRGKSQYILVLT